MSCIPSVKIRRSLRSRRGSSNLLTPYCWGEKYNRQYKLCEKRSNPKETSNPGDTSVVYLNTLCHSLLVDFKTSCLGLRLDNVVVRPHS